MTVFDRTPGEGKYAHLEREQRWLLEMIPADATDEALIYDRYISGTRLRLRRIERNGVCTFKLTQKIPAGVDAVKLTNNYLSADEYDVFATLPAREIRKTRRHVRFADHDLAVDEFDDGLLLGEVELTANEPYLPLPPFALRDVTDDPAYSGGALAR